MSERSRTRIVLADDHPLILNGLEELLRMEPQFEIVGRCTRGLEALETIRREKPDLCILDVRMPDRSGIEVLAEVGGETSVILLTAEIDDEEIPRALDLGARGLILKERAADLLLACVDSVLQGEQWIDSELTERASRETDRQQKLAAAKAVLSRRELEITRWVAEGLKNREVAKKLFISEGTVKTHLRTIFEKLQVDTRVELVNWARREGLL